MKTIMTAMLLAALMAGACAEEKTVPAAAPAAPAVSGAAEELDWMTDFAAAQDKARAGKKAMLLDFTGSDWCGWCKKLDREVFSTPEFREFAKANLVLVKLDFPRRIPQSEEVKAQNQRLQARYRIEGYPTLIILDPEGKEIGRTGYRQGGAEAYVQHLKGILGSHAR